MSANWLWFTQGEFEIFFPASLSGKKEGQNCHFNLGWKKWLVRLPSSLSQLERAPKRHTSSTNHNWVCVGAWGSILAWHQLQADYKLQVGLLFIDCDNCISGWYESSRFNFFICLFAQFFKFARVKFNLVGTWYSSRFNLYAVAKNNLKTGATVKKLVWVHIEKQKVDELHAFDILICLFYV